MNGPGLAQYTPLISLAVVALVLMFRMRQMMRMRPFKLKLLWVTPALLVVVAGAAMASAPPAGLDWVWLALALVLGGVPGWYRGRMMRIEVDPETQTLGVQASPAALVFLLLLVVVRYGLRYVATDQMQRWKLSPVLITDAFLMFAIGLVVVQRFEMGIRAGALLAQARAAPATAV